ncbi:hypothetical protein K1X84_09945 [bacterium]|nr:hypothetical protein [bacterium]
MRSRSYQTRSYPSKPGSHRSDHEWLRMNSEMITKRYANQWIAVYKQSIIAHGDNPEMVRQNAQLIAGHDSFALKHIEKGIVIL